MARDSAQPTQLSIRGVLDVLDDAREALNDLRSPLIPMTPRFYRRRIHEILNAAATARYAMDAITKSRLRKVESRERADAFESWKKKRRADLDSNVLVTWFDTARDDYVHRAISPVIFSTHVGHAQLENFEKPHWVQGHRFQIWHDGIYWVDDEGTPEERREFAHPRPGTFAESSYAVTLGPTPQDWAAELYEMNADEICGAVLSYYRVVLREYWDEWWVSRDREGRIA